MKYVNYKKKVAKYSTHLLWQIRVLNSVPIIGKYLSKINLGFSIFIITLIDWKKNVGVGMVHRILLQAIIYTTSTYMHNPDVCMFFMVFKMIKTRLLMSISVYWSFQSWVLQEFFMFVLTQKKQNFWRTHYCH